MVKKSRIQRLIEAIKSKRWHDANVLTSRILEGKVMARLNEERKGMFKGGFMTECPMDGDGGSPMSDNPGLKKEDDENPEQDGEPVQEEKATVKKAANGKYVLSTDNSEYDTWEAATRAAANKGIAVNVSEGYYRVTYLNGRKEETLKFQGSPSEARAKVAKEAGAGKTIVDVETLTYDEYNEE